MNYESRAYPENTEEKEKALKKKGQKTESQDSQSGSAGRKEL